MKLPLLLQFVFLPLACLNAQNRFDVVIDELMADPAPQIGLPIMNGWN
jgi:hypothetical protein